MEQSEVQKAASAALANIQAGKPAVSEPLASAPTPAKPQAPAPSPDPEPDGSASESEDGNGGQEGEPDAGVDEGEGAEAKAGEPSSASSPSTEPKKIVLPASGDDEAPFELEIGDEETERRLTETVRLAEIGRTVETERQTVMEMMNSVEEERDAMAVDPVGYMLRNTPNDPEVLEHLALYLLTQPQVWNRVGAKVLQWDDPSQLQLAAAEQKAARAEMRERTQHALEERKLVQRNLTEVVDTVKRLIPENLKGSDAQQFYNDALRDIKAFADRHQKVTIDVEDIPVIIAKRLRQIGSDPVGAAANAKKRGAPVSGKPTPQAARPVGKSGQQFVREHAARKAAGGIPGAGVGSPPAVPPLVIDPKKGSAIQQALAHHKKHAGALAAAQAR